MAVFQNRPYERHIVSNIPTLLATGSTLDALAVGQIGIFDAKTNLAVTAPTYAANKAIYIAQGTPDRTNFPEGAGVPNIFRKTHTIQGKRLISLRGKKGNLGHGEIVTLGFDGVDLTKTLTAKPGETFYYWVRLTGDPIFNLNPDRSKGVIIQGAVQMPCQEECADNCTAIECNIIADLVLADFNTKILPGGQKVNKYVSIKKVLGTCSQPTPAVELGYCTLEVADNGTAYDLGQVQAQFPGAVKLSRTGVITTYGILVNSSATCDCPAGTYSAPDTVIHTDCATCEVGTFAGAGDVFTVTSYLGDPTGIAAIIQTAVDGLTASTVTVVAQEVLPFNNNFVITVTPSDQVNASAADIKVALAALVATTLPGYQLNSTAQTGTTSATCTVAGTNYSWSPDGACATACSLFLGTFKLTLKDDECGNTFATAIAEAYPTGTTPGARVGAVRVTGSGCVHEYEIDLLSNCVDQDCLALGEITFATPAGFAGEAWTKVDPAAITNCVCGLEFTSVYVPRETKECTFDQFAYQTDWVHVEVSSHNPDWRSTDLCETDPIATRIQNGAYPNGAGQAVARLEKQDRMYDMDYFYMSPVLREAFDFYFETDLQQTYDMVAVEYDFQYSSNNGFGQTDNDRYIQYFWLPEGQTGALVTALNGYAASVPVQVDPITTL